MERWSEEEGRAGEARERKERREPTSVAECIHEIAKRNARASLDTEKQLKLYLQSWWSRTYNRPLKDPLLEAYTLEELIYEFYDRVERKKAEEEGSDEASDKMEEARFKENLDWAEEEERKELEELEKKKREQEKLDKMVEEHGMGSVEDQREEWMEEQVQKEIDQGKKLFGDDFGENIDEEF